jgi:ribosomal protein S12 methylthiotransferase accessory factor
LIADAAPSRDIQCLEAAHALISCRVGLIKSCHELLVEPDDARLFNCYTRVASTSRYAEGLRDCYQQNGGAALTREAARAAAIGETIERYACSVYNREEMILATWSDLARRNLDALHPSDCPLFASHQYLQPDFGLQPFTEDTLLRWIPSWSVTEGRETWTPAVLTYTPYHSEPPEVPIAFSVSTGLSCSLVREEAVLNGLYECLERDAVMITWLNRLPAVRLDPCSCLALERLYSERFAGTGTEYMIFDLTLDLCVPIIFGLAVDREHDQICLASGASANFDVERAATKALVEAAQGRLWLKYMRETGRPFDFDGDFTKIRNFEDHVRLYGRRDMLPKADFLVGQTRMHPIAKPDETPQGVKARIRKIIATLKDAGLKVFVSELTPPDVAGLGFHVVKLRVPGLQQLYADNNHRSLGSSRLYQVPVKMGYRSRPATAAELNPDPHPFP